MPNYEDYSADFAELKRYREREPLVQAVFSACDEMTIDEIYAPTVGKIRRAIARVRDFKIG